MKSYKILGLILARGGSKSIPKKNIYPILEKPMLVYTFDAASKSKLIGRIILSTDDGEIAESAKSFGVEIPFMRPKELAKDLTPDLPVFEHALEYLKKNEGYIPDIIVHLRPTSPLKSAEDIDKAIQILIDNPEADSVRSVCEPAHTPFKMWLYKKEEKYLKPLLKPVFSEIFKKYSEPYNMPRQMLPQVWKHSGYVDVVWSKTILEKKSMSGDKILPFFFEKWKDVDVDSMREIKLAEIILKEKKNS